MIFLHSKAGQLLMLITALMSVPALATERVVSDYMLSCQGCHLSNGRGYPEHGVPKMNGFVANFLKVPGGREYLVQVPGSAQAALSDERLAALLNWILTSFSEKQLPEGFVPYSAAEVRKLRIHPIVKVTSTRAELVQYINKITP